MVSKSVTKYEEREAALKEMAAPITKKNFMKVQRVHEINALIAPYQNEIERIKEEIYEEMDRKGVNKLTHNGVEVVSRDKATSRRTDINGLMEDHPDIFAAYVSISQNFRVNWKKPMEWAKKQLTKI